MKGISQSTPLSAKGAAKDTWLSEFLVKNVPTSAEKTSSVPLNPVANETRKTTLTKPKISQPSLESAPKLAYSKIAQKQVVKTSAPPGFAADKEPEVVVSTTTIENDVSTVLRLDGATRSLSPSNSSASDEKNSNPGKSGRLPFSNYNFCRIQVSSRSAIPSDDGNLVVPPMGDLSVTWTLPDVVFSSLKHVLVLCLCRVGSRLNSFLAVRNIDYSNVRRVNINGINFCIGTNSFYAPKTSGMTTFRIIEGLNIETREIAEPLFPHIGSLHASCGNRFVVVNSSPEDSLQYALESKFTSDADSSSSSDKTKLETLSHLSNRLSGWLPSINGSISQVSGGLDAVTGLCSLLEDSLSHMIQTHSAMAYEVHSIMTCLSAIVIKLNDDNVERRCRAILDCYSTITRRLYPSKTDREEEDLAEVGFAAVEGNLTASDWFGFAHDVINRDITAMAALLFPKEDFYAIREEARYRIEQLLQSSNQFRSIPIKIKLFGSACNGVGLVNGSDVDCLLESSDKSRTNKLTMLKNTKKILTSNGFKFLEIRTNARVPVFSFSLPSSGLSFDLVVGSSVSWFNSRLLLTYMSIDVRVRCVAYIIRIWAKRRHLNSPSMGSLSSYGWMLMLIHCFQRLPVPILPVLTDIGNVRPNPIEANCIDHNALGVVEGQVIESLKSTTANCYFHEPSNHAELAELQEFSRLNPSSNCQLLHDFFYYFSNQFKFDQDVISIRQARMDKIQKLESEGLKWPMTMICIEDPFEVWYNVAHVVSARNALIMMKELARGHRLLSQAISSSSDESLASSAIQRLIEERSDL